MNWQQWLASQWLRADQGSSGGGGSGSVTSVDVDGGTTGLTFSGGPVTSSGTITLASPALKLSGTGGAGYIEFAQQSSAPSTPAAGKARLYVDSATGEPYLYSPGPYNMKLLTDNSPVTVGQGGTNATTASGARTQLGLVIGTNVLAYVAPGTSGNVLTSNGSAWTSAAASGGSAPFSDATAIVKNNSDNTKLVILDASLVTTGTTRTLKAPNVNDTLAVLGANTFTGAQTLPASANAYAPSISWVDGQGFDKATNGLKFQANGTYVIYLANQGAGAPGLQVANNISIGFSSTSDPSGAMGPQWFSGSGSPESVLSAPAGSLYSRTDGGAGTSLYVKESGSGNTGWVGK